MSCFRSGRLIVLYDRRTMGLRPHSNYKHNSRIGSKVIILKYIVRNTKKWIAASSMWPVG